MISSAQSQRRPCRRGVDTPALIAAIVAASLASLLLYLVFVPAAIGAGDAGVILRYMASVAIGADVLPPPASLTAAIVAIAVAVHVGVSAVMAISIAFVLHRWGLVTGVLGGAALGVVFFAIVHYSLTLIYPHFYAMHHWSVVTVHAVFGAVAGGVYEWLECEPWERDDGVLL